MAGLRSWLRRLERLTSGDTVTLGQQDGTKKTFPAEAFWLGLFIAAADAACDVVPEGPVPDALNNATPEDRGRIELIVASGQAGDFMRGSGGDGEGGLLEVADDVPDLSEPA